MDEPTPRVLDPETVAALDDAARADAGFRGFLELLREQPGGRHADGQAIAAAIDFHTVRNPAASVGRDVPDFAEPVSPHDADLWVAATGQCQEPAVRARLHHLLLAAGHGERHLHARAAASAYVELAMKPLPLGENRIPQRLCHSSAADWAHELSRRMGDVAGQASAVEAIRHVLEKEFDNGLSEAGIIVPLVERLVTYHPRLPGLAALLEGARDALAGNYWQLVRVIHLQQVLAKDDPDRAAQLQREEVEAMLSDAEELPGAMKQSRLSDAARRAADLGLVELRKEATRRLQAIPREDLGLVPIASTLPLTASMLEGVGQNLGSSGNIHELLVRLVAFPPSGNLEANRVAVATYFAQSPLVGATTVSFLDDSLLPTFQPESDEERLEAELARREDETMLATSVAIAAGLSQALEALDPSEDELTSLLHAVTGPPARVASGVTQSLQAFRSGRYEEAAALALIRVEAQVRALAERVGTLHYQVQQGLRRGQFPQLGALLESLEAFMDPSWWHFLENFLVGRAGLNYRNRLFHGYIEKVDAPHAVLAIVAAVYLAQPAGVVLVRDPEAT